MENCIFCKIARREIPKEFVYQDSDVMVFDDIHPLKPVHLLVVPKKHIPEFRLLEDSSIWNSIRKALHHVISLKKLEKRGYKLLVNGGGAQEIDHLHVHLLGPVKRGEFA